MKLGTEPMSHPVYIYIDYILENNFVPSLAATWNVKIPISKFVVNHIENYIDILPYTI